MDGWANFMVGQVGASAALAGLVFVGISINLTRILAIPQLPSRALEALIPLVVVLLQSSLLLIPGQPPLLLGGEVGLLGLAAWVIMTMVQRDVIRKTEQPYRRGYVSEIALGQLATLAYVAAGVAIALSGSGGVYWVVPAILLSYVLAISDAWVLLVEINR